MNALRTEDELRDALDRLSADAPTVADVLSGVRTARRGRRLAWLAPLAAAAVVAAVAFGLQSRGGHSAHPAAGGDPRELVAVTWKVLTIDGKAPDRFLSMTIKPNGLYYQGVGSCDGLQGRLRLAKTQLVTMSRRPSFGTCIARPGQAAEERQLSATFREVFAGRVTWSLAQGHLTLHKDGASTVVYRHYGTYTPLRQWTYRGVGISVPATWRKDDVHCGMPVADTVLFPAAVPQCAINPPANITYVKFAAYDQVQVGVLPHIGEPSTFLLDGVVARDRFSSSTTSDPLARVHSVRVDIPSLGVTVTITAPNSTEAGNLEQQLYIVHP